MTSQRLGIVVGKGSLAQDTCILIDYVLGYPKLMSFVAFRCALNASPLKMHCFTIKVS